MRKEKTNSPGDRRSELIARMSRSCISDIDLKPLPQLESSPGSFVWLGREKVAFIARDLIIVEANIDDMNPEFYNYVSEKLFALGALEVSLVALQMKKNRPGVLLRVLIEPLMETAAAEITFSETTTLEIRVQSVKRIEIPREVKTVSTVFGPCKVKLALLPNGSERSIPEYEECRRIAEETGTPLPDVYSRIARSSK